MTDLELSKRQEPFEAQALVTELAIEALGDAILPWLARVDQARLNALVGNRPHQRPSDELESVVGAQITRHAALASQPRQHFESSAQAVAAIDLDHQALLAHWSVTAKNFNCWLLAYQSNTKS